MVTSKSGILKLYFVELPKEVQERFNYNPEKAAAYSAKEQNAALQQARKQQQEATVREQQAATVREQQEATVREQNRRAAKVEAAIANGEVVIGMTGEECVRAWGWPESVNTTDTARVLHSHWFYSGGQYVYFENGILTSIQQHH
jgi:hypothetical protein